MQRPSPSIERTCPGKPGCASRLKRWLTTSLMRPLKRSTMPLVCGWAQAVLNAQTIAFHYKKARKGLDIVR